MMIRPLEALQTDGKAITEYCDECGEPVYLTVDGAGKYVLLSQSAYEQLRESLEIQDEVFTAMAEYYRDSGTTYSLEEAEQMLEEELYGESGQSTAAA